MSVAWDDYLPDVRLEAPGCPTVVAVNAVRSAAIELCSERGVWQDDLDRLMLTAADPLCDIVVPTDSEIAVILDVRFYAVGDTQGRHVIGPTDELTLNALRPDWKDESCVGAVNKVSACLYLLPLTLRVIPIPVVTQNDALLLTVTLRPTRASTSGPDLLYTDYLETITTGALAKLLAMNKKPWTDLEMAADKRSLFKIKKARAAGKVFRGGGAMSMHVHPRTLA